MKELKELSPRRKAAIILLRLGSETSGPLLKELRRPELQSVMEEVSRLGRVDIALADAVLKEFLVEAEGEALAPGDEELAYDYLESTFGKRMAREILGELSGVSVHIPFQFLDELDADVIAENLSTEHPQTIALVLSHLTPENSAAILTHLPDEVKVQVGIRLGTMDKVPADAMAAVETGLRARLSTLLESQRHEITGGVDSLVDLLTVADKSLEETVLGGMSDQAAELAAQVKAKLFTFADVELIEDRQMQLVLRNVDAGRLPLALKGTADIVRDKFLNNLSSRARENLLDELELLGSVRMADVEEAQAEILEVIRGLEETGELVINRGGGDFVS